MANESGLSRRDVMKKGAVAGAIVWSAPLLTSTPAFAATGCGSGSQPCVNFYFLKIQGENSPAPDCASTEDGSGTSCANYTAADLAADCGGTTPASPIQNGCGKGVTGTFTARTANFFYPTGIIPIIIQLKPGNDCFTFFYDESDRSFNYVDDNQGVGQADPLPGTCEPTFTVTDEPDPDGSGPLTGGINVAITYPQACPAGLSHVNTYFCD